MHHVNRVHTCMPRAASGRIKLCPTVLYPKDPNDPRTGPRNPTAEAKVPAGKAHSARDEGLGFWYEGGDRHQLPRVSPGTALGRGGRWG